MVGFCSGIDPDSFGDGTNKINKYIKSDSKGRKSSYCKKRFRAKFSVLKKKKKTIRIIKRLISYDKKIKFVFIPVNCRI